MLQIHFLEWLPWSERVGLPPEAGLYRIARGEPANLIYVGRTWGEGGIRERIRSFHRSAMTGQKGHAGGQTYFRRFGADVGDLIVSAHVPLAINPTLTILKPYIDYAERRVLWEHVERVGALPECNTE